MSDPIDPDGYSNFVFMNSSPALDFRAEVSEGEDRPQAVNEDGDPMYSLSFAVSSPGRFNRIENKVIDIQVAYPKGKDPAVDLAGRRVRFEGLVVSHSVNWDKHTARTYYSADSVSVAGPAGRPETKPTA